MQGTELVGSSGRELGKGIGESGTDGSGPVAADWGLGQS